MIETSAHLIDHVIPPVPTRQWVLSFPWPLRFLYASRPKVLTRTLAVITRAIETDLIHRAGLTRKSGARSGIVTLIQRFGSALNLNVHLHMIVIDGVYTFDDDAMRFHSVKAPGSDDMKALLDRIIRNTSRYFHIATDRRLMLLIRRRGACPSFGARATIQTKEGSWP